MPTYAWRHVATNEVVEVTRTMSESNVPPDESGEWERVYSFGVGRVEGGGSSPGRSSVVKNG